MGIGDSLGQSRLLLRREGNSRRLPTRFMHGQVVPRIETHTDFSIGRASTAGLSDSAGRPCHQINDQDFRASLVIYILN